MSDEEVEHLLQEVQLAVRGVAWRYFHDSGRIEDLVQEHSLAIWAKRTELDPQKNPRAFAISAMHFICLRARERDTQAWKAGYQGGGYEGLLAEDDETPLSENTTTHPLARGDESSHLRDLDVRRAFDDLPAHLWIVAWLVHGEGFMVSETARRLGLPRLIAEQRLQEATARLQVLLKDWR